MPDPGDPYRTWDPFDCATNCWRDGRWDDLERASRGCTRPDLPEVAWDVDETRLHHYVGRAPSREVVAELGATAAARHDEPGEDPADGCPGGYRYAAFGYSVVPNARDRTKDGGRVPSPLFDRACRDNPVMEAAIHYFEFERERRIAYCARKAAEQRRVDAENAARRSGRKG